MLLSVGEAIVEINPSLLDSSFISDLLTDSDVEYEELKIARSIPIIISVVVSAILPVSRLNATIFKQKLSPG